MNEAFYSLMHRDDPVCAISIDTSSGVILRTSKPLAPELLPLGGNVDSAMLKKWWQRRAVPVGQGNVKYILKDMGFSTTHEYLIKNLGLSLSDHYWIKPLGVDLSWTDVNLFTNEFHDPFGELQLDGKIEYSRDIASSSYSPGSSTQGELTKKWVIADDGRRCLIKGNHGESSQESLNEVLATLLHQKQNIMPYVHYSAIRFTDSRQTYCICDSFTSEDIEFISAIDIVESKKKDNAKSLYEHFISVCVENGLQEESVRSFLEYQILTDFVLTNIDRHLNNFGVLRNTRTLRFIGMAPIFDSGNSMFWQSPRLPQYDDLTNIITNSFRKTESKLLQYVSNRSVLDISKLPTIPEILDIYRMDEMIPFIDSILLGYQRKIELLNQFQSNSL